MTHIETDIRAYVLSQLRRIPEGSCSILLHLYRSSFGGEPDQSTLWRVSDGGDRNSCEGPDLSVCMTEFLRRVNWSAEQKMVLLPAPEPFQEPIARPSDDLDDEIPF